MISNPRGRAACARAVHITAVALFLVALGATPGCGKVEKDVDPGGANVTIQLQSPAFEEGGTIPKQYTGDGKDASPPLNPCRDWNHNRARQDRSDRGRSVKPTVSPGSHAKNILGKNR